MLPARRCVVGRRDDVDGLITIRRWFVVVLLRRTFVVVLLRRTFVVVVVVVDGSVKVISRVIDAEVVGAMMMIVVVVG
jgi:hypothetical protein